MRTAIITTLMLISAAARAAGTGYLDTDRAINECADGKRAVPEIKKMDDACRTEDAKKKPAVRTNVDEERLQACLKGVDKRRGELARPIAEKVRTVLPGIAKKHGFTAIMPASSAAWVAPGLDVTEDVIKAVDTVVVKPGPDAKDQEIERLRAQLKARDEAKPKAK
jgi:Skp family chaperone for outer membrane proteins